MPQTKERRRELYRQKREEILAKQRQYWRDNPDKARTYNQRSYWSNPEARRSSRRDHYQANRDCELQRNREYHKAHYAEICEQRQEYYEANRTAVIDAACTHYKDTRESLRHVRQRILSRTKNRAKKLSIPFDLTLDDIYIPDVCPVFGVPFDFTMSGGRPRDNSPSIDKFIPILGYVKGNVYIISHRANFLKSNASLTEMEQIVSYMRKSNK